VTRSEALTDERFAPPRGSRIVIAGIGSDFRRDDGIGPVVARRFAQRVETSFGASSGIHVVGPLGDPLDLLGEWDGAELAVVIDATRSDLAPGTISVIELGVALLPGPPGPAGPPGPEARATSAETARRSSTHGIGLAGVLRLARAVGRAPVRAVVVGIEGEDFAQGAELSPSVEEAVEEAVSRVAGLVDTAIRT